MKRLGSHHPGQHRIFGTGANLPTRPMLIVPTGGGGDAPSPSHAPSSPILLPDLVAGWSLTAGPQQTLSSAGVVASGSYDLTAHGSPTYGATGVVLNGSSQYLDVADAPALRADNESYFWSALVTFDGDPESSAYAIVSKDGDYLAWGTVINYLIEYSTGGGRNTFDHAANQDFVPATGQVVVAGGKYMVNAWYDAGTAKLYIKINDGTVFESSALTDPPSGGPYPLQVGRYETVQYFQGKIKYLRFVKGEISEWVSAASWLANMSGGTAQGRTDAEVAAYTG